jgi:hypothetical protein
MYSTIMLVGASLGSLLFLIDGVRNRGNRRATLEILAGLFGLLYVGLGIYWHMAAGSWQSRGLVVAYYVAWHFSGGVAAGMLLYVARFMSARVLLTASTAFLVMANLFLIPRQRYAIRTLCLADGFFGGILIASLTLIWFEHRHKSAHSEQAVSRRLTKSGLITSLRFYFAFFGLDEHYRDVATATPHRYTNRHLFRTIGRHCIYDVAHPAALGCVLNGMNSGGLWLTRLVRYESESIDSLRPS